MQRFRGLALAFVLACACEGVLREKSSGVGVDAGFLGQIPTPPCDPPVEPTSDGHHRAGEDCLMCHHQGGEGPPFTFAGTLYEDSGGARPLAGGSLHLIDATGNDILVSSQANGNFWATGLVTFPLVAFGSLCPDVTPMLAPLGETDGNCNKGGCHTSGFRVHVP